MNTTIGSQCLPMTGPEIKKAKTDDGTAEDIWATPQSLMPPTVPPQPAPMPYIKVEDDPLVIKKPETKEAEVDKAEAEAPEVKQTKSEAAQEAAILANQKVQAHIKKHLKQTTEQATEAEKFALEVRKTMEAPLSPNGFLVVSSSY